MQEVTITRSGFLRKSLLSSDHPISGEEEGDAEADGQEEEVGAEGQQQPGVEEQEEEEGDGGGDRVEGGGEDDGRAGEVGAAGEEARVQGFQFCCLDFYGHKLFPQILPTSLTFTNISHL